VLAVGRRARLDRFHAVEMHERQSLQIRLGTRPPDHFLDVLWVQFALALLVHAAEWKPPIIDIDRQIMVEALEVAEVILAGAAAVEGKRWLVIVNGHAAGGTLRALDFIVDAKFILQLSEGHASPLTERISCDQVFENVKVRL
jgi:hypothetical protein